jgi:uncharacterized membrane protein
MSSPVLAAPAVRDRVRKALPVSTRPKPRVDSVDLLRGVAIVFMVLDHVRDYFSAAQFSPTDLSRTTPALFFTRWVTHFCAPVFVSLAGTGVYLSARRGKTRPELARFLFTRGVWLILLELTVLRFGMCFSLDYHWVSLTILWAIGWSMIALSALIALPIPVVAGIGIAIILGHNLLDGLTFEQPHWLKVVWTALHGPPETFHTRAGIRAQIMYPVLPWIGVMACGYAFGAVLEMERPRRRRLMLDLGLSMIVSFVEIRVLNAYGDPNPWKGQATPLYSFLSFLSPSKYPPSLLFLLMTLGPALVVLAWMDRDREPGGLDSWLITFGRVPMFFFLLHWQVIHALAALVASVRGQPTAWMFKVPPFDAPDDYGYTLPVVYLLWVAVVVGLYPACHWFAELKRRRRDLWWLSYF